MVPSFFLEGGADDIDVRAAGAAKSNDGYTTGRATLFLRSNGLGTTTTNIDDGKHSSLRDCRSSSADPFCMMEYINYATAQHDASKQVAEYLSDLCYIVHSTPTCYTEQQ